MNNSYIVRVKNNTAVDKNWVGKTITAGTYYQIPASDLPLWRDDDDVFLSVANGELVVNDGTNDITDPTKGWNWLLGNTLPYSDTVQGKLAVHASSRPLINDDVYVVWTSAGDDPINFGTNASIGNGELLVYNFTSTTPSITKEVKFDPAHGRVWLHEAYIKFENAGVGDYLEADVVAPPTQLQTTSNLDLEITPDNWVVPAAGGPGTGTHGFAGNPVLIKRSFSKDGDWDYDPATGSLIPNTSGTGMYKISNIERNVHRYVNKFALLGTNSTYFSITSEETTELPVNMGYFLRITAYNNSGTAWRLSVILEIYRTRTVVP